MEFSSLPTIMVRPREGKTLVYNHTAGDLVLDLLLFLSNTSQKKPAFVLSRRHLPVPVPCRVGRTERETYSFIMIFFLSRQHMREKYLGQRRNNHQDETSPCFCRHVALARAHTASTSTDNTFCSQTSFRAHA